MIKINKYCFIILILNIIYAFFSFMVTYFAKDIAIRIKTSSIRAHWTRVLSRLFDWFNDPIVDKNRSKIRFCFRFRLKHWVLLKISFRETYCRNFDKFGKFIIMFWKSYSKIPFQELPSVNRKISKFFWESLYMICKFLNILHCMLKLS